jgi:hypothetical protein
MVLSPHFEQHRKQDYSVWNIKSVYRRFMICTASIRFPAEANEFSLFQNVQLSASYRLIFLNLPWRCKQYFNPKSYKQFSICTASQLQFKSGEKELRFVLPTFTHAAVLLMAVTTSAFTVEALRRAAILPVPVGLRREERVTAGSHVGSDTAPRDDRHQATRVGREKFLHYETSIRNSALKHTAAIL